MNIIIGSDHAGFFLKEKVVEKLKKDGHTVVDAGPETADRVDYPVYGSKVGHMVASKEGDYGIVICGSGIGISIAANKVDGIRAALCGEPLRAKLSREHNDANVLAMGSRLIGETMAMEIVDTFLNTAFIGGRHCDRVALIGEIERSR
jgi:ribose 5-phosphate isomerase B